MDLGLVTSKKLEHIETCKTHLPFFNKRLVAAALTAPV